MDPGAFAKGVTWDATSAGGSPPACASNVRAAWGEMLRRGSSDSSREDNEKSIASVASPLRLCPSQPLSTPDDLAAVMDWLQDAFDYLAMGNYPYRSSYILNGDGTLPPYPFRVACGGAMADPKLVGKGGDAILSAIADAVSVFYNYTGDKPCFNYTVRTRGGRKLKSNDPVASLRSS